MKTRLGDKIADGEKKVYISREEKEKTQRIFMKNLENLMAGRTNEEFANDVGLSRGNIYSYISGIRFPTAHALKRIADRCDASVDWLLGRIE